jgi:hypothetical protein
MNNFVKDNALESLAFKEIQAPEGDSPWSIFEFTCVYGRGLITASFTHRTCDIHHFDLHDFDRVGEKRQGNGRAMLLLLRTYFDTIDVPNPVAHGFWRQMQHENLVRDLGVDYSEPFEPIVFEDLGSEDPF